MEKLNFLLFTLILMFKVFQCEYFIKSAIGGGTLTNIGSHPYNAVLNLGGEHHCGAAILRSRILITAAHCISKVDLNNMIARVGTSNSIKGGQIFKVKAVAIHSDFGNDGHFYYNDIALIRLSHDITFNNDAKIITIAYRSLNSGSIGTFTGYGEPYTPKLYMANLPIVSKNHCERICGHQLYDHFCAGVEGGSPNPYIKDDGGPLIKNGYLVAIASYVNDYKKVGVFTDVVYHSKWVEKAIEALENTP